jgi:hypothetical protein
MLKRKQRYNFHLRIIERDFYDNHKREIHNEMKLNGLDLKGTVEREKFCCSLD